MFTLTMGRDETVISRAAEEFGERSQLGGLQSTHSGA